MKKKRLFLQDGVRWNKLVKRFINIHHRLINGKTLGESPRVLLEKLNRVYSKLKKLQYSIGVKVAGSAIALMLISANTSFAQDFTQIGNLGTSEEINVSSVAYPTFADIDGDSDLDLYVGNQYGNIQVFINDGYGIYTATGNLQADGSTIDVGFFAAPEFIDIDGDNDLDLYVGNSDGNIQVFINDGSGNFTAAGNLQADGSDIDVGDLASPVFADIDGDSDLDLYVGDRYGYIQVFTNDGGGNFTATGNLQAGGSSIDVGYFASPTFADIDGDSDLDLYVGNDENILVFTNDGNGNFTSTGYLQADGSTINIEYSASPVFADIDGDSDLDLYVGDRNGKINVFINEGSGNLTATDNMQAIVSDISVGSCASPVFADIDGDSNLDIYVGNYDGKINVFTNDGKGNFTAADYLQTEDGADIDVLHNASPVFEDIDKDGDLDLYVGERFGHIRVFINDGSGNFTAFGSLQADGVDIDAGGYISPVFSDIDGDGNLDLYVGNYDGYIRVFSNDSSGNFTVTGNLQADGTDINVDSWASPVFADLDRDGDLELYVGNSDGNIQVFTNDGSGNFIAAGNLQADGSDIDVGDLASPAFADIDGDGKLDLYVGNGAGKIIVFKNVTVQKINTDGMDIDISVYPNPSSEVLNVDLPENFTLTVTDITGKEVFKENLKKGQNTIDLHDYVSGVYLLSFKNKTEVFTTKIIKK